MRNKLWIILMILSLIFILIGIIKPFEIEHPNFYSFLTAVGFLLQVIFYTRMFWYKNYVQWNKLGAVVKINSFIAKSISFEKVNSCEIVDKTLVVSLFDGKSSVFNLDNIDMSDAEKLKDILLSKRVISRVS